MSRYNTQVLSSIRMLCRMRNINEKVLYERAKLILSIYREVSGLPLIVRMMYVIPLFVLTVTA